MTDQSWQNEIAKLRSGNLSPEQRAKLEQELRQRAPELEQEGERLAERFQRDLEAACREQAPPDFEELQAYVDGTLDDADREVFESRLADDALLRQEVQDLQALRVQLTAEVAGPGRVVPFRRPALIWTGLLAAAALIFVVSRLAPPDRVPPSPRVGQASPRPSLSPERLQLRDGADRIVLRADGSLQAPPGVAADLRPALLAALAEGRLSLPKTLDGLQGRTGVLMGPASAPTGLAPLGPVGTCVRAPQPAFRWHGQRGARAYVVAVFDEQLEKQADSGELQATEWRPARPLARGRTYLWQVTALTPQGRVVAPAPPLPQARLRVLSVEEAAQLESRLAGAGGSLLAEGVLLTSFGLLDDAEQRFSALVAQNPGSAEAAGLLAQVRDRSR